MTAVDQGAFTDARVLEGYGDLFDPLMREAHRAVLGFARLPREDKWPDPKMVCAFAKLYGVPAAELGAFFGHFSYKVGRRTVWGDVLANGPGAWAAKVFASRQQAVALGFLKCATR